MIPLGVGAGAVSTAYALTQVADRRPDGAATTAAATTLGVIAITVTVNEPANHQFTAGALTDAETRHLLDRWARWHHLRVALGLVATTAAAPGIPSATDSSRRELTGNTRQQVHEDHAQLDTRRRVDAAARTARPLRPEMRCTSPIGHYRLRSLSPYGLGSGT